MLIVWDPDGMSLELSDENSVTRKLNKNFSVLQDVNILCLSLDIFFSVQVYEIASVTNFLFSPPPPPKTIFLQRLLSLSISVCRELKHKHSCFKNKKTPVCEYFKIFVFET